MTTTSETSLHRRRDTRELPEAHHVDELLVEMDQGGAKASENGKKATSNESSIIANGNNGIEAGKKANSTGNSEIVSNSRSPLPQHLLTTLTSGKSAIKCEIAFKYRPFGFSISADENSLNAVVTKVYTGECIRKGVCIGYCVAQINGEFVLDKPHQDILHMIRTSGLPCILGFIDRGQECQVTFRNKPLGFSILRDENKRNAKVHEVKSIQAQAAGVCPDWVLIKVNDVDVWGKLHDEIVTIIKMEPLPITCTFRVTPPLLKSIEEKNSAS